MKIFIFLVGLVAGMGLGFAVAAWALYEPITIKPAKYALTHSPGPVPPYAIDGSKKIFQIECISLSEKDCVQPVTVSIPAPGTLGLFGIGLVVLGWRLLR